MAVTEERKKLFLATLAQTGSWRAAAAAASGHLIRDGHPGSRLGVGAFANLAKRDPAFAEQVREALDAAIANVEHALYDRINLPNRRPIFDKQGNLLGHDENWRDANMLGLRFLERHDQNWVQKKQIDGTQHVVHSEAGVGSGAAYVLKPADIMLLPPEKRAALIALLEDVEQARDEQEADAPADARPALPGPEGGDCEPA
jgi:hypothetical protein